MVVEVESPKVTEIDQEEAKERKDADKELSKTAWKLVWNRKTPFFATGLLALTFSIRVAVYRCPECHKLNLLLMET
jgi:hypothetical protein